MSTALSKSLLNDSVLASVDKARHHLSEAKTASEAKKVVDVAHAAEIFAKRQKMSDETIGYAHAVMVDATRLLGSFLKDSEKNAGAAGGGKKSGSRGSFVEPRDKTPTLADFGITKKESSIAQKLAEMPTAAFEQIRERKITVSKALRACKKTKDKVKLNSVASKKAKEAAGIFDVIVSNR